VGFKPTISAGERLKTYALDRAATGTGKSAIEFFNYPNFSIANLWNKKLICNWNLITVANSDDFLQEVGHGFSTKWEVPCNSLCLIKDVDQSLWPRRENSWLATAHKASINWSNIMSFFTCSLCLVMMLLCWALRSKSTFHVFQIILTGICDF
jgi:hypothetical protein